MRTSKLVRDLCNMPVQPNKAIVGSNAFSHSSGIHQDGVLKAKKTYEIMTPQSVGLKDNRMNLTSRSGSHMVKARLLALGYSENEIEDKKVYDKFKALADKKGTIYDDDLVALMESKSNDDLLDFYTLEYLNVASGRGTEINSYSKNRCCRKGLSGGCMRRRAVDAATKAIDRIVGIK